MSAELPIGYIYTSTGRPSRPGWLPVDGATYQRVDQPELYVVLERTQPHLVTGTSFALPLLPGCWIKARS